MFGFVELPWVPESGHLLTKSWASSPSPDCIKDSTWASAVLPFHFSLYKPHDDSDVWLRHSLGIYTRDECVFFSWLLVSCEWRIDLGPNNNNSKYNKSILLLMSLAP